MRIRILFCLLFKPLGLRFNCLDTYNYSSFLFICLDRVMDEEPFVFTNRGQFKVSDIVYVLD